ncbi:MAG: metallophosphatase family protein [Pirellulaceae bacterium]|jgi:predicted phosphodiesterase|nr:metallophosphatase family protein [Pirellulaceae bacterium]
MKRAILSDIHGNLEALEAVLADVASQGVDGILCLGDIVGYGPNPRECIDRVMEFQLSILGNHDQGALYDPEGFSSGAERAIFWTREQLEMDCGDPDRQEKRWEFLSELPRTHREGPLTFVHGSVRNPLSEYVFPEDVHNFRKLERLFALIDRYAFQGHTHVPGVFTEDGRFLSPDEIAGRYPLPAGKLMVNVGSVGQPRDGDPRACYVMLTENEVEFRRVRYPVEQTMAKIHAIPELDPFLAERLQDGR